MTGDFLTYLTATEEGQHSILATPDKSIAGLSSMADYHLGLMDQESRPARAHRGKRLRHLLRLSEG